MSKIEEYREISGNRRKDRREKGEFLVIMAKIFQFC